MPYTKTEWKLGVTALNEDNLNNLETQYQNAINDIVPALPGGIAIWSGLISNIPEGWVICDGNNGTPNLLDRFICCVPDALTNPGATGGSVSKTSGSHTHELQSNTTSTDGAHSHDVGYVNYGRIATNFVIITSFTGSDGGHSHMVSKPTAATTTISDIRPPYFEVAFIMRT